MGAISIPPARLPQTYKANQSLFKLICRLSPGTRLESFPLANSVASLAIWVSKKNQPRPPWFFGTRRKACWFSAFIRRMNPSIRATS